MPGRGESRMITTKNSPPRYRSIKLLLNMASFGAGIGTGLLNYYLIWLLVVQVSVLGETSQASQKANENMVKEGSSRRSTEVHHWYSSPKRVITIYGHNYHIWTYHPRFYSLLGTPLVQTGCVCTLRTDHDYPVESPAI